MFEKEGRERQFFADLYKLCEKYWKADKSDAYWMDLVKNTDAMSLKYSDIPLASRFMVAFIEEKEAEAYGRNSD